MKKAIVFAGGGSKGAYQIGAWKALDELGESFQIATGTSIGSINAALYVQHDFDRAYTMWKELTPDSIMTNGINLEKSFDSIFSQREQLIPFLKSYISSKGADVTPFHNELKKYYNAERFFSSEIDYALMTVRFPSMEPVEIHKSDFSEQNSVWQWIAASSACFPVFPVMQINGEDYIDGGYYDNVPVAAAFKLGAKQAVVIDLKTENNHEGYIHHPRVKYIKPSKDLGSFLNFEREALEFSLHLGYTDVMKAYGKYLGHDYVFIPQNDEINSAEIAAEIFTDLLTQSEAAYDFSGSVRFQRVNKLDGTTTILAALSQKDHPNETDIFIAALELLLNKLGYDDKKDYLLNDLIYDLKIRVDGMYPLLEFDMATAFEKVQHLFEASKTKNNSETKKFDETRMMLIYTSVIRALQQTPLK